MPLVFQYGSNCNTERLNRPERVDGAATHAVRAETVDEFDLAFDVWSRGNGCAASDLIPAPGTGRHAWGVLYRITDGGLARLREIEGPLYAERTITVRAAEGREEVAITFTVRADAARPGLWTSADYVGHIVSGLRTHNIPEEYVHHVIGTAIDTNRRATTQAEEQNRLIAALR
jgi:hypothetical protein